MKISKKENPFRWNTDIVRLRRQTTHLLFGRQDEEKGLPGLVQDTASEVLETQEELHAPNFDQSKAQMELVDAMNVWTATALFALNGDVKPEQYLIGVNGEGKYSNSAEKLLEITYDMQDDIRAIPIALRYMWSLGTHQMGINAKVLAQLFIKANDKFVSNYPSRYFSGIDQRTGKIIPTEHQMSAFEHYKTMIRAIRNKVQRVLVPQDYVPYDHLISDWRNPEFALAQLKKELLQKPPLLNGEVKPDLITMPNHEFIFYINKAQKNGTIYQQAS